MTNDSPQEWEDIVLPLFDQPAPEPVRARSRKEEDDHANKIIYQRYKGPPLQCRDCFDAEQYSFSPAAFIRIAGDAQRPLCFRHRALWGEREALSRDG